MASDSFCSMKRRYVDFRMFHPRPILKAGNCRVSRRWLVWRRGLPIYAAILAAPSMVSSAMLSEGMAVDANSVAVMSASKGLGADSRIGLDFVRLKRNYRDARSDAPLFFNELDESSSLTACRVGLTRTSQRARHYRW